MWIERKLLKEINNYSTQYPALVVTGARQTGKTSILQRAFPTADYVTLDYPVEAAEADQDGLSFLKRHREPLIIDEVQYAPQLFRFLKIAIDKDRQIPGRFLLTGSQRFPLMKHVSESLAGRIAVLELLTLSLGELELAFRQTAEGDQLVDWILQGGYPEVHAQAKNAEKFFANYIASYIERDVRSLINIKSARDFDRFLRLAASRTGQLISYASLASDLGLSGPTVRDWMSVLEASHIIQIVEPWFTNEGKRIIKTPKLYFLDTGLCCHLLNIRDKSQLLGSPILGAMFETHVLGQMRKSLANRGSSTPIYFFRDHAGHELDFLIPVGKQFHVFECKWTDNPKLDSKNLDAFKQLYGEKSVLSYSIINRSRGKRHLTKDGVSLRDSIDFDDL